jgi:hypothetical protein
MSEALQTTMGDLAASPAAFRIEEEASWLVAKERRPVGGDALRDSLGRPGLWRYLRAERREGCEGGEVQRIFELPPAVRAAANGWDDGSERTDPDADLLDWAAATAGGHFDGDVIAPSAEELEEWAPREARRIRAGSQVGQVDVIADASRLALIVPALVRIPSDLSPTRAAWLAEICHDAQAKWRLVRFGIDDAGGCVRAEVDLTGCPGARSRVLFELALAALVVSSSWALPGFGLVVDASSGATLFDRMPSRVRTRKQPTNSQKKGERA